MRFHGYDGRRQKKIKSAQRDKVRADVGVESCAEAGSNCSYKILVAVGFDFFASKMTSQGGHKEKAAERITNDKNARKPVGWLLLKTKVKSILTPPPKKKTVAY